MQAKTSFKAIKNTLGVICFHLKIQLLPETKDELDLFIQLNYKQAVEIAEEEVIDNILEFNRYEEVKKRVAQDLTVLGIGAVKTDFNLSEGVTVDYVDPANLVYSYTEDPNFEDVYYVGEVKSFLYKS